MTQELNDNDKWLAAEFALGALDRENMQIAEQRFENDPLFRAAVDEWQNQLTPMLDEVPSVAPDPKVWDAIAASTGVASGPKKSASWGSRAFWRGLAVFSSAVALASLAALLYLPGQGLLTPQSLSPLVATLNAKGDAPTLLASFSPDNKTLMLRAVLPEMEQTKVAELWLVPADGVPRSLGLLDKAAMQFNLNNDVSRLMSEGGTLAISLEPKGGSPTGAPTGPVIASGKLRRL